MIVKPCFARAFAVLVLAVTGNGNEPNVGNLGGLTDEAGDLATIQAREADIEENDVGPACNLR